MDTWVHGESVETRAGSNKKLPLSTVSRIDLWSCGVQRIGHSEHPPTRHSIEGTNHHFHRPDQTRNFTIPIFPRNYRPRRPTTSTEPAKPTDLMDDTEHPVGRQIEKFLAQYLDVLPARFTHEGLTIPTTPAFWRALILTYSDRYGQGLQTLQSFPELSDTWSKPLADCIKGAAKSTKQVRKRLAQRMDTERLQMQRPLAGRSLLSITTCRHPPFTRGLRALTILGIHPLYGVEGYRVSASAYVSLPFTLPKCLQDTLPILGAHQMAREDETTFRPSRIEELHVTVDAPKLTRFLQRIYAAAAPQTEDSSDPFAAFVQRVLPTLDAWNTLGAVPSQFCAASHGFVIRVPFVVPGKQAILWSTWHATAGVCSSIQQAHVTAFVDLVPRRFFTDSRDLDWYRYCNTHAPSDPGAGSSRGAYLTFVSMVMDIAQGLRAPDTYGLPQRYLSMFSTGLRHAAIDNDDYRGFGTLTSEQLQSFTQTGYLILDLPTRLEQRVPASASLAEFSQFFRNISRDSDFRVQHDLHRVVDMKTAERDRGDRYAYFSCRVPPQDPVNPLANGCRSRNAPAGGKLIPQESGLGKGSTFVADPSHLAFQYSCFVYNVMSSFYSPGTEEPLVVVNERFRTKTTAAWKNGTQMDTTAAQMIPGTFHQYRTALGLPSFS